MNPIGKRKKRKKSTTNNKYKSGNHERIEKVRCIQSENKEEAKKEQN